MSSQSQSVNHSSHPHPLHLTNIHNHQCDACEQLISGFSYRCAPCDFDLHTTCALMPLSLTHQSHPHQLFLIFSPPYHNRRFTCGICDLDGYNHWLYRCESCRFDAHLGCIHTPNIQPTHTQSYQSTSTANLRHWAAGGTQQFPTGPMDWPGSPSMNFNSPAGPSNNYGNHGHGSGRGNINSLMNQGMRGFVTAAARSLSRHATEEALNHGHGGGDDGGYADDGDCW